MRVLLTGGAGYIGSHTAVELINAGHTPVIADNYSNSCPEVLNRIKEITGVEVEAHEIDMCDAEKVDKLFATGAFDAVIHFAGLKAVGESVSIPVQYYRNNIDSTLVLLDAMTKYGVANLIFSSSATVYGNPERLPLTEDCATGGCTNPYGWTKYMIEQIIRDAAKANPNLSAVLLRYFNPVGAHASGRIGEDPSGIPNNLMPFISQVAVGRRTHLSIFGNDYNTPDGTGVRDYIHVVDLARGHVASLPYCASHKGSVEINLGTGTGYSVKEMAEAFARVNDIPVPYQYAPRRPGDIDACYADPVKAKELLGWEAQLGLEEMCRDTWNWQKNNPNGYKGAN
ncbi:MAG: UDP-glucose 4-epimerase GalE [Clostridia bacterium]|nr:UDP-glucose 4-epimerase GalE [Clostridia bacterium]